MKKLLLAILTILTLAGQISAQHLVSNTGSRGDFHTGDIAYFMFNTADATGAPASLVDNTCVSMAPEIAWSRDNAAVDSTGLVLTTDVGGTIGQNQVSVNIATTGATPGYYELWISCGKIGTQAVTGSLVASYTVGHGADLRYVNGGSTGSTAGKLELVQLKVTATGGDNAVDLTAVDGVAFSAVASGIGSGGNIQAQSQPALTISTNSGAGGGAINIYNVGDGSAVWAEVGGNGAVLSLKPDGTGKAINALGQIYVAPTHANDDAVHFLGNGTGHGLNLEAADGSGLNASSTGNAAAAISGSGGGLVLSGYSGTGIGLYITGGTDEDAVSIVPQGTGKALNAQGQVLIAPSNMGDAGVMIDTLASGAQGLYIHSGQVGLNITSSTDSAIVLRNNDDSGSGGKAIEAFGQIHVAPTLTDDDAIALVPNGTGKGISGSSLTLQKNVALAAFPFVMYSTSGSPASGLTVTCQVSKDGGAFGACANAVAEISAGAYKVNLATSDVNANTVILKFTATGARPTLIPLVTQP